MNNLKKEINKYILDLFSNDKNLIKNKIDFGDTKENIFSSIFVKEDFKLKTYLTKINNHNLLILNVEDNYFGLFSYDDNFFISTKSMKWYELSLSQQGSFLSTICNFSELNIDAKKNEDINTKDLEILMEYINYCIDFMEN